MLKLNPKSSQVKSQKSKNPVSSTVVSQVAPNLVNQTEKTFKLKSAKAQIRNSPHKAFKKLSHTKKKNGVYVVKNSAD